jgi:hypothetical protein
MVDGQKLQTLLETLNVRNQDLYPNIYAIFTVLITMPVSSASSERSFSAMRRVKNCLRATMGDERLSNLSLLHIHRTTNLQWEKKTDVWTLSNYQSVLLDMMAACAYMNSETLFFECFRECFFRTFCIYDNLRYRFNALWCWIFVTVKIIMKSGVETFIQNFSYSAKIY